MPLLKLLQFSRRWRYRAGGMIAQATVTALDQMMGVLLLVPLGLLLTFQRQHLTSPQTVPVHKENLFRLCPDRGVLMRTQLV